MYIISESELSRPRQTPAIGLTLLLGLSQLAPSTKRRARLPQKELPFPAQWWGYLHQWQGKGVCLPTENKFQFWWGLQKSGINWRWTVVTNALNYCRSPDFSRHVHIIQEHCISPPTAIAYVQNFLLQLFTLLPGTLIFYKLYTWWILLTYLVPLTSGLFSLA